MDVSGETADILIKEGVLLAEGAVKLAGTGIKNIRHSRPLWRSIATRS